MVVGGLPIPCTTHAARIANMALGMRLLCKEVISPVSREPIGVSVRRNWVNVPIKLPSSDSHIR